MRIKRTSQRTVLAAAFSSVSFLSLPAYGLDANLGELSIQMDTQLSLGFGWRAEDIDYRSVGPYNAKAAGKNESHLHGSSSQDNSNLRYEKGETFSEILKGTIDLDLVYKDYGAFTRGRFWYDNRLIENEGGSRFPQFYPKNAGGNAIDPNSKLGSGGEILDAFVWGNWYVDDMPLNMRLGRQVISWGEGLFFPNGINTINPIDVNALLAPGAELKEALIPVEAFYASLGVNENLSLEVFYQFKWAETRLPGCGTFYSTTDLVGYQSCDDGYYASGGDAGATVVSGTNQFPAENFRLPRGETMEADDDTQYGIAARYFIPSIEMELAGYFVRYNSRLPLIGGTTPSIPNGILAKRADGSTAFYLSPTNGFNDSMPLANVRGTLIAATQSPTAAAFLLPYSTYVVEYPDDIQLFGLSMNTSLDMGLPGGATAIAAEVSMRKDQPFQIEDGVLLAALVGLPSQICANAPRKYDCYTQYSQNELAHGFIREDYYQAEISFVHFFDQILGASRWTAILDLAYSLADIPDPKVMTLDSSYNAALAYTYFPTAAWFANPANGAPIDLSNPAVAKAFGQPYADKGFATDSAWGYKLRFSGEYTGLVANMTMIPTISFSHDVSGITPGPITNFLEDRQSLGLSAEFIYQNIYSVKLGYTSFFGAEPYNQLADRDNYTLSTSMSF